MFNNFIEMEKTMQHFNQYNTQSELNWEGSQSNRFPKMRLMHPSKDLIQTGTRPDIQAWTFLFKLPSPDASTTTPTAAQSLPSSPVPACTRTCTTGTPNPPEKRSLTSSSLSRTPGMRKDTSNNLSASYLINLQGSAPSTTRN